MSKSLLTSAIALWYKCVMYRREAEAFVRLAERVMTKRSERERIVTPGEFGPRMQHRRVIGGGSA